MAKTIQLFGYLDPKRLLEGGKAAAFAQGAVGVPKERVGDAPKRHVMDTIKPRA